MSILDIDLKSNIMDFSKPNRNGRVYDPDSIKVPVYGNIPNVV
jgi:hypothetical protein